MMARLPNAFVSITAQGLLSLSKSQTDPPFHGEVVQFVGAPETHGYPVFTSRLPSDRLTEKQNCATSDAGEPKSRIPIRWFATWLLACVLVGPLTGCVALNIPSDRHHDHADQGGLFGPWKGGTGRPVGLAATAHCACGDAHCVDGSCGNVIPGDSFVSSNIDDGSLTVDPFDTTQGEYAVAEVEEVPWPRFHPLPTRPIFGNYR